MMTKEQLMPFCSVDETHAMLCEPWYRDGFTIATDRRILIRVPGRVDGVNENSAAPNIKQVLDTAPADAVYEAPPIVTFYMRDRDDDGAQLWRAKPVEVGARLFGGGYLYIVRSLPGARIQTNGDQLDPAHFTFSGGDGMLMPLRPEEKIGKTA
jgi:hypothetical protein